MGIVTGIRVKFPNYLWVKIREICKSRSAKVVAVVIVCLSRERIRLRVGEWVRSWRGGRRNWCSSQWARWCQRTRWRRPWGWLFRFLRWQSRTRALGSRRGMQVGEWIIAKCIFRSLKTTETLFNISRKRSDTISKAKVIKLTALAADAWLPLLSPNGSYGSCLPALLNDEPNGSDVKPSCKIQFVRIKMFVIDFY